MDLIFKVADLDLKIHPPELKILLWNSGIRTFPAVPRNDNMCNAHNLATRIGRTSAQSGTI